MKAVSVLLIVVGVLVAAGVILVDSINRNDRDYILAMWPGFVFLGGVALSGLGVSILPVKQDIRRRGNGGMTMALAVLVALGTTLVAPSGASAQSWVDELFGKKRTVPAAASSFFESLCLRLGDVHAILRPDRAVILGVATDLVKVFTEPRERRVAAGECDYRRGAGLLLTGGKLHFGDGPAVMEVVVGVLKLGGFEPKDIGMKPRQLRNIVQEDLVQHVQWARKQDVNFWLGRPGSAVLLQAVKKGVETFNFTHEELRLTEAEVAAVRSPVKK